MEEKQVTIDGEARPVPQPFFVIATQNPIEYQGTFPLPEAQMDRFAVCLSLGYPSATEELAMLIAYSATQDPVYQLESRKYIDRVRKWLENVPEAEKRKLMNASSKFSESVEFYLENLLFNIANKSDKDPLSDPRIKSNEAVFMRVEGFSNVWNSMLKEVNLFEKLSKENNINQNVITEENRALFVSKSNVLIAAARNKMKETIDSIFD
jgi:Mg-chelatase subunit ChlI